MVRGIGEFQNIAVAGAAGGHRITSTSGDLGTAATGIKGFALAAQHGSTMSTENKTVLAEFQAALTQRYGAIGIQAFDATLGGKITRGSALLARDISVVLTHAEQAERATLAAGAQPAKNELMARAALQQVTFPNGPIGDMCRPLLLGALSQMAEAVSAIDQSDTGQVLVSIAKKMASEVVDQFLMTTLVKELVGNPPGPDTAENLITAFIETNNTPANAMRVLLIQYPAVSHSITTYLDQTKTNMTQMATRLAADMPGIAGDFASAWPVGTAVPTGITDIKVTSSDPHHGGNRVSILTLSNGEQLVYKPRDTRVDAKLAGHVGVADYDIGADAGGDDGASALEIGNTLLQQHLGEDFTGPMQTYQYRNGVDAGGRYGYVQHLSTGTPEDHSMTRTEMAAFTRNLGREVALMNLLGVRDLHHSNMMVSGGQPMFSDVEIAFDEQTFAAVRGDLSSDAAEGGIAHFEQSQLSYLFRRNAEGVREPTLYQIGEDGNFSTTRSIGMSTETTIENFVHISNPGDGEPPSNRVGHGGTTVFAPYAEDFATGYAEMLEAIVSDGGTADRFKGFIDTFAGMHVRYHPIETGKQLETLQNMQMTYVQMHSPTHAATNPPNATPVVNDVRWELATAVTRNIGDKQDKIDGWPEAERTDLSLTNEAMVGDLLRGDVPYFTRELGLGDDPRAFKLFHNGAAPIQEGPADARQDAAVFRQNPLEMAKSLIDDMAPTALEPAVGQVPEMRTNALEVFVPKYRALLEGLQQRAFDDGLKADFRDRFPGVAALVPEDG